MGPEFSGASDAYARSHAYYAVITVLDVEFLALKYVFGEPVYIQDRERSQEDGVFPFEFAAFRFTNAHGAILPLICCKTVTMGNNAAAIAATVLRLRFPNIQVIFVCGIAAGMPVNLGREVRPLTAREMEHHVRIGDVIVADKGVLQYDYVAAKEGGKIEPRSHGLQSIPTLSTAISGLRQEVQAYRAPWRDVIAEAYGSEDCRWQPPDYDQAGYHPMYRDGDTIVIREKPQDLPVRRGFDPDVPYVHFGKIGSANMLLRDFEVRDRLCGNLGILGVEMEGSGATDAAWTFGRASLVIRGACDYADHRKGDLYHEAAAINAAAVLKCLLNTLRI